jgi:peptidyl-prolyl cis-trans isomerase SurA
MRKILMAIGLMVSVACIAPAHAELAIAAVVNDEVISSFDLQERVQLLLATSGKQVSAEELPAARAQILQGMINDTLKLQESKRYSIRISADEIKAAMAAIEQQQGKPAGSLSAFINARGLSLEAFKQQMESQVAWRKLLGRTVRSELEVSDEEVTRAQQRLARGTAIPEVRIASILVPPQEGISGVELENTARDIYGQLARGVDASALLSAYSERLKLDFAPVRWVPESRLAPELLEALSELKAGEITQPIPTPVGLQIIRLLDRRTLRSVPSQNAEVAMKQIILKLGDASSDVEIESKMDIARDIARYPGSCTEAGIAGLEQFAGLNIEVNYYRTTTASMSPEIRTMIDPMPVTGITDPFASADGIHLLMLCERISVPAPLPDADKVRSLLLDEKVQLESEKYLRRLRREAFIDVRI